MQEQFSSYITSVMTVGICAFICESIAGGFSKNSSGEKGLNLICSLCMLTVILLPIASLLKHDFDIQGAFSEQSIQSTAESNTVFSELIENEASDEINRLIFEKFGIQPSATSIDLNISDTEASIRSIHIILSEKDYEHSEDIKAYLMQSTQENTCITTQKE